MVIVALSGGVPFRGFMVLDGEPWVAALTGGAAFGVGMLFMTRWAVRRSQSEVDGEPEPGRAGP